MHRLPIDRVKGPNRSMPADEMVKAEIAMAVNVRLVEEAHIFVFGTPNNHVGTS